MLISSFFGFLIGTLGILGMMKIGSIQPPANIVYATINLLLILILRKNKNYFKKIAWVQVTATFTIFTIALLTVPNDEFRMAWYYVVIYMAYMLLGERAGNFCSIVSILTIVVAHNLFGLNLSDTAIATAIFSLIVFGLLSRAYTTQMNNYEKKLIQKNTDLAKSIISLDIALKDAHSANRSKSLFLANMSHEIRTPMNGMLSLVQLLQTTRLDETQHEYLQSINRAGGILMNLIDDLLDLSHIESGKLVLNVKEFRLWDFIEDILLQAEHLFDRSEVHFNVDIDDEIPGCLIADEMRLKQVVINLINNAAKFTSQGTVDLKISGAMNDSSNFNFQIEVIDTGIGIPGSKIDSIFEPFQQLEPARIYNKGVGLGLPICKRIIEAMKGEITIESVEGNGTRIVVNFILPLGDEKQVKDEKVNTDISFDPISILLVEDDQISRLAVKTLLGDKGHHVIIAENGREAINHLEQQNVDVIIMDVHMPEMNGIEAVKIIKEQSLTNAPIIGMTASVMNDERQSYIEAGMEVLIEKPLNFEKLMGILKNKITEE